MPFPKDFNDCPVCHTGETICRLACDGEPSIPKGTFVSLEKVFTPIQDVAKLIGPLVKGIMCHYDVCANCGTKYCTRAEIISVPATVTMAPHQKGKPFNKGR